MATRKGLFVLRRDRARSWQVRNTAFLGVPVTMVFQEPVTGILHAALEHGHFGVKLHRSMDDGVHWEERPVPVYPPKPDDVLDLDPVRNEPIPWSLKTIWALAGAHPATPDTLWCGTIPGGLFRSNDGGTSWVLVRELWDHPSRRNWLGGGADYPGIHSILVDPRDANHITLAVSCGGVWVTRDGGTTWQCQAQGMRADYFPPERAHEPDIQDVHRIAHCRAQPGTLWAQHHNGIYVSRDDAASWVSIEGVAPSVFGFTVAAHPNNPDTAWFVPADKDERRYPVNGEVVVNRTRDGGRSFQTLRSGLPQQHAYDLVFRHGLDVDDTGEWLTFGSTSGSLFVSENSGDDWSLINAHFPPVYCVRFAR